MNDSHVSQKSIQLLKGLTQADAISGHEFEVKSIFRSRLEKAGDINLDRIGSIFCTKVGDSEAPRILLDSHMDEIGFIVQRITSSGFVKFVTVGGWWPHTLLAQRVNILTKHDKVPGVIGATPPHLLDKGKRDQVMDLQDLYIDIGAEDQRQAVEDFGVKPGCAIVPVGPFLPLKNPKLFSAKAFDNRVGVALVIETLEQLNNHPNTVIGCGTVQEEVGLRGATTIGHSTQPDVAIVLECPPADDIPGFDSDATQGKLGNGCQVRLFDPTHIANPRLADFVIQTAEEHKVPHQIAIRQSGGTNAGAIHKGHAGVPSIVLGVPARYIHSHVSIIHIDDYHATLDLILKLVSRLDESLVDSFIQ